MTTKNDSISDIETASLLAVSSELCSIGFVELLNIKNEKK